MSYLAFIVIAVIAMASSLSTCSSSPQVSGEVETCWKPLVVDTVIWPDSIPNPGNSPISAQASPVWSNSGELVAYSSWFDSCNNPDKGIYIADSSGGSSRRKIPVIGADFKWLPGDTQLIVNTGFFSGGELVIYNINTSSVTPLGIQTRTPLFDVSQDGRYIYYESEPVPPHQGASILEYDRETGTEWAVVAGAIPMISPDRSLLAYGFGGFFVYRFADSSITEFINGGRADWTPESDRIVYTDGFGELFVMDTLDNAQQLTGENSVFGAFGRVSVSPDGKRVLYEKVSSDFAVHIWEISIDGGVPRQFSK